MTILNQATRPTGLKSHEAQWNVLDIVTVSTDTLLFMLELILDPGSGNGTGSGGLLVLRVLRIFRVIRLAKLIRVMRFFREFRIMVYSLISCARSLLWVVMVLIMMLSIFGITFVQAVSGIIVTLEQRSAAENLEAQKYFGTAVDSMMSLYMGMTGGEDWRVYYDAMQPLGNAVRAMYIIFITFAYFAVANVVTGIFVQVASQSSLQDHNVIIDEELRGKEAYLDNMRHVFEEMDFDNTGTIEFSEFTKTLQDEKVIAYFNALKLDVTDAAHLFSLLDFDGSGSVDYEEFIEGCYRLQGEGRALDIQIIAYELEYVKQTLLAVQDLLLSSNLINDSEGPDDEVINLEN